MISRNNLFLLLFILGVFVTPWTAQSSNRCFGKVVETSSGGANAVLGFIEDMLFFESEEYHLLQVGNESVKELLKIGFNQFDGEVELHVINKPQDLKLLKLNIRNLDPNKNHIIVGHYAQNQEEWKSEWMRFFTNQGLNGVIATVTQRLLSKAIFFMIPPYLNFLELANYAPDLYSRRGSTKRFE